MKVKAEVYWYMSRFAMKPDVTRTHIQVVRFVPRGMKYHAIATDGHRMGVIEVDAPHELSRAISIKIDKDLVKARKPNKTPKELEIMGDCTARVIHNQAVEYVCPRNVVGEEDFPPYQQVIPDKVEFKESGMFSNVNVNPDLICDVAVDPTDGIRIYTGEPFDPIIVTATFDFMPVLCVAMPIRYAETWKEPFPTLDLEHWKS